MSKIKNRSWSLLWLAALVPFSAGVYAQQTDADSEADSAEIVEQQPAARITPAAARGNVVNLQTTVTGNQEQPRVLYILPWQSPQAGDIDFELLGGQEASVFGHVERTEFRRQLEAAGEFD